jgi:hypothetical protein
MWRMVSSGLLRRENLKSYIINVYNILVGENVEMEATCTWA